MHFNMLIHTQPYIYIHIGMFKRNDFSKEKTIAQNNVKLKITEYMQTCTRYILKCVCT